MKKVFAMILLSGMLLHLTACSGQENAAGIPENNNNTESVSKEDTAETEPESVPQELTMELLLELFEDGALAEKVNAEGLNGFLQYENLESVNLDDDSLTGLYSCSLVYSYTNASNETEDREYEFQLYYWKPETAEEYDHEKNEIDEILLREKQTNDAVLLYHSEDGYTLTEDLAGFLEKDYGMEQYLTVSLPEGYAFGSYAADLGYFSGWLLEGNAAEPIHSEWTDASWYAPGGIGRANHSSDILQFEDGNLTGVSLLMNHSGMISEIETIENCEVSAALAEFEFDLFTAAEWTEYLEKNPDADQSESVSRYWYIFLGEEESDNYYVLFLNEELFSKEDAIGMARSIQFTENAF